MSPRRSPKADDPQPAAPTVRGGELLQVAPGELRTTGNVREDLRLDEAFQASIAELGVQVPILAVRGEDGTLAIEQGHRRAAAAVAAGLPSVPVVVLDAQTADAQRVLGQLAENQARAGLTTTELVAAHQQLALLGVSLEQAARATGSSGEQVRAARTIATDAHLNDWLEANHGQVQLDLETIATLAEFADDPEVQAGLVEAALQLEPFDFARTVEEAREDRARDARLADAANEWTQRGWAVVVHANWPHEVDPSWVPIWKLRAADGAALEEQDLDDCPGRAAALTEHYNWSSRSTGIRATLYVANPTEHGYTVVVPTGHTEPTPQSKEAQAEQRRAVLANNKAWRAAETVRRAHVRTWLTSAKPTPAMHRWALAELLRGVGFPARLSSLKWASDVLRGEHQITVNPRASAARANIGVLTVVLADRELATSVESWRHPYQDSATSRYLRFLTQHTGYKLSDVEALAAGPTKPTGTQHGQPQAAARAHSDGQEVDVDHEQDVTGLDGEASEDITVDLADHDCAAEDPLSWAEPDPLLGAATDPLTHDGLDTAASR